MESHTRNQSLIYEKPTGHKAIIASSSAMPKRKAMPKKKRAEGHPCLPLDTSNLSTDEAIMEKYRSSIKGLVTQLYERQQYFGKETVCHISPDKEYYDCIADATTELRKKADCWHTDIFKFRILTYKNVVEARAKARLARLDAAQN